MQLDVQSVHPGMHAALVPELQGPFRGPLFKELFGEFPDLDVPEATASAAPMGRSGLYAHTTDVQSLAQFLELQEVPLRQGTVYHHKQYLQHLPD